MKKITTILLLSLISIYAVQAQGIYTGSGSLSGNTTVTMDAYNLIFGSSTGNLLINPTNSGGVGIGTASAPLIASLGVANISNSSSPPFTVFAVANQIIPSSTIGTAYSTYSILDVRLDNSTPPIAQFFDFSVDQNGLAGFGFPAAYFNPSLITSGLYFGTRLGVVDPNNSDTTPLFTVLTNQNNPISSNIAALTVDYRGYISLGGYFPADLVRNPAHLFLTDPNPSGTDPLLDVVTNATTQSLYIGSNGKVGIGTTSPSYPLDVNGDANLNGNAYIGSDAHIDGNGYIDGTANVSGNLNVGSNSHLYGNVVVGTVSSTPSGYNLYVQNGILTEKAKVAVNGTGDWSDYVFDKDYKFPALSEVECYIKTNKHLPGVPSADDVVCDGVDLGSMDATLLKKIEELTLYMLELKKDNDAMKAQLNNLSKK